MARAVRVALCTLLVASSVAAQSPSRRGFVASVAASAAAGQWRGDGLAAWSVGGRLVIELTSSLSGAVHFDRVWTPNAVCLPKLPPWCQSPSWSGDIGLELRPSALQRGPLRPYTTGSIGVTGGEGFETRLSMRGRVGSGIGVHRWLEPFAEGSYLKVFGPPSDLVLGAVGLRVKVLR